MQMQMQMQMRCSAMQLDPHDRLLVARFIECDVFVIPVQGNRS